MVVKCLKAMIIFRSFFLRLYYNLVGRNIQRLDDVHSYPLVKEFLPTKTYFPITGSALGFHALATIINDIVINGRKNMMEFGAGISTVVFAKYASLYNNNFKVISVEHDRTYLSIVKAILEAENLTRYVLFIESDLENQKINGVIQKWYSYDKLDNALQHEKLDVVVIDGPISKNDNSMIRYPAIDYISSRLSGSYSIYLDDIHRKGEKAILDKSLREYKINFRKISQTVAIAHRGVFYNPIP